MAKKYTYYTQEGYDKMKSELNELKTKGRADMSKQIAEARDKGDLSENAEYDAAKDAQGMLEMRISDLEKKMGDARVLDESMIDMSKVSILSTVKIKNQGTGMEISYTLVPEEEADLKAAKISVGTPIAAGLLGKKVGDIVEVKVPAGAMKLEVLEISR
ncbi:MAG: transcription elongation factor GreA [Cyclobacteriaceae bacterium]